METFYKIAITVFALTVGFAVQLFWIEKKKLTKLVVLKFLGANCISIVVATLAHFLFSY